jgi:hypothetical protein
MGEQQLKYTLPSKFIYFDELQIADCINLHVLALLCVPYAGKTKKQCSIGILNAVQDVNGYRQGSQYKNNLRQCFIAIFTEPT